MVLTCNMNDNYLRHNCQLIAEPHDDQTNAVGTTVLSRLQKSQAYSDDMYSRDMRHSKNRTTTDLLHCVHWSQGRINSRWSGDRLRSDIQRWWIQHLAFTALPPCVHLHIELTMHLQKFLNKCCSTYDWCCTNIHKITDATFFFQIPNLTSDSQHTQDAYSDKLCCDFLGFHCICKTVHL